MKPSGFWQNTDNINYEIETFNLEHGTPGVMPKELDLKVNGCSSLAFAIQQQGGFIKFAIAHGYQTSRRPNGHFNTIDVLKAELLAWVKAVSTTELMPTAQELKEAVPPRHDLVSAISKHGGFCDVAEKTGLCMSHDNKPNGHYDNAANLAREIYAFVDKECLGGMMPTKNQLSAAQKTGLIRAIYLHGNFWSVAKTLGLSPNRKHFNYWTHDTIDSEIIDYLRSAGIEGVMPMDFELREAGRNDLCVAIPRHGGGMVATAKRLGLISRAPKPDGYWDDGQAIAQELQDFIREHGTPGHMPTQTALAKAGRTDLSLAISRAGGGWTNVSNRLGLELTQMPKGYWNDLGNVKATILAFNARSGRSGEMPTKTDLDLAGEFGLGGAIEKLGGYPAVAALFGFSARRITLWPRSRDELILAHELKLFFSIDLDDRKVSGVNKKNYDADIVIRSLNLIIEYDSHYYHKDQIEPDSRKTVDLQNGGWSVIRIREEPLARLQPSDVPIRGSHYKEMCNRVLLALQEMHAIEADVLDRYLERSELQNSAACELFIEQILKTKRGNAIPAPWAG